jgi:multiple sugar transport system permease protein
MPTSWRWKTAERIRPEGQTRPSARPSMPETAMYRQKYIFLLPGLLVLVAVILFPLIFTIRVSFSSWDVYNPGLNNAGSAMYARLWDDSRYWEALWRLSLLSLSTVLIQYVLGFALALLVWRDIAARRFLRVLFLVPMMTTPVVMSVIWRTIFHESLGPLNPILEALGIGAQPWLSQATHAFAAVMIVEIWQWTPFMFLLLLAGLLSLPSEPFLAARVDGAGPVRTFLSVTFPMMGAISVGAILIRAIEASKIMETVYVLTSGGPGTATETVSYYIYIRGMRDFQIGYAAALSLTYLVIMAVALTLIAKALIRLMVREARA